MRFFLKKKNAILRGLLFFYECFLSLDGGKGGILGALRKYSFLKTGRSFGEHRCETVIIAFHFHSFFPFSKYWILFFFRNILIFSDGGKGVSWELCENIAFCKRCGQLVNTDVRSSSLRFIFIHFFRSHNFGFIFVRNMFNLLGRGERGYPGSFAKNEHSENGALDW